ncbi:MAB_1171c family putative transporter [Kutzneria buriramensis]|uniref:DUF6545 domain-containing protein n=1 Tax=Kutzneria buriramensis TaxID=1045776 RepID=A0A3E0HE58_9PSEU|nr:MAB_1171c family putative transporter [Kutzneria buriramensis]REH42691.1 hypothetical protein BCF44_110188 [Kutzneria buriramensis]
MRTVDLLNLLITIANVAAVAFWWRSWRQTRKPAVTAMLLALVMLCLSMLIETSPVVTPVPAGLTWLWITIVVHLIVLVSDYWWQVFALRVRWPIAQALARARWRRNLTIIVGAVMVVCFAIGPLRLGLDNISSNYGGKSGVLPYLIAWEGYHALTMASLVVLALGAKHIPDPWLRFGVWVIGLGGASGFIWACHRIIYTALVALGTPPPWPDYGATGVGTVLLTTSASTLAIGVLIPPLGQIYAHRRAERLLLPLWRDLTSANPDVVFPERSVSTLRARATEIRDVLIGPLRSFLDPAVEREARSKAEASGLRDDELRVTVDAAVIAAALAAQRRGAPVQAVEPVVISSPDDANEAADVAWLARIASAYMKSPIVAAIRESERERVDK